jgi:hypothetical protein
VGGEVSPSKEEAKEVAKDHEREKASQQSNDIDMLPSPALGEEIREDELLLSPHQVLAAFSSSPFSDIDIVTY